MENVVGMLIILFAVLVFAYVLHKEGLVVKEEYDEYQKILRGNSFRYAFYGMICTIVLGSILSNWLPLSLSLFSSLLLYIGISIQVGYCIWVGAYFPINQGHSSPNSSLFYFLAMGVLYLLMNVPISLENLLEEGADTSLLISLFFFQMALILGVRMWRARKNEEDE